jgi:hypothetical protein
MRLILSRIADIARLTVFCLVMTFVWSLYRAWFLWYMALMIVIVKCGQ